MTRKRHIKCKAQNCPHEELKKFSDWIRVKLPESKTGYMVTDLDFILYNYKTKRIAFLEVKTRNYETKTWQKMFFTELAEWIRKGTSWEFLGYHEIKFENTDFEDGKVYLDNNEITEKELVDLLSF